MKNLLGILKKEIFPISLILILAFARLMPHPPNFTPVIAVAIMSSYFFRNIYLSFATMLISMLIADFFIGFYGHMIFVYISLLLITFAFFKVISKFCINLIYPSYSKIKRPIHLRIISNSLIFFI